MTKRHQQYESNHAVNVDFDQQASELEYRRTMGAYKPHFESIPDDHYPASWCDVFACLFLVLFIIGGGLGLMIGFLIWDFTWKTPPFILLWSIVFAVFTVLFFLAVFIGGRMKIKNERKIIHQKLATIHIGSANQTQDRLKY